MKPLMLCIPIFIHILPFKDAQNQPSIKGVGLHKIITFYLNMIPDTGKRKQSIGYYN